MSENLPDFSALLAELRKEGESIPDVKDHPAEAFRKLFDGWVERGGYERGKPRHAVRRIKIWLEDHQVRSLETKLAGKTRLQREDAANLIRLFLDHWIYDPVDKDYVPYRPKGLDELTRSLVDELFAGQQLALLLPLRSRTVSERQPAFGIAGDREELRPSGNRIRELFEQSDVLVTVSRARTVIGSDPAEAMTRFQRLMEDLRSIADKDDRQRALFWIVDMGLRNDTKAARRAIYNLHFLAAQFRAIALIATRDRNPLYKWLRENACVAVGSLKLDEIDQIYSQTQVELASEQPDLRWFQSDRLFLESIPGRWLDAPGIEALGRPQSELWQVPTVTVHFRRENWQVEHPAEVDTRKNLIYFFHGEVRSPPGDRDELTVRCVPLPEPGSRWSDSYRLACNAAFGRLGWDWDKRLGTIRPPESLAQLRDQHLAILRLDEFLQLPDLLVHCI